jgi:hypothetical protein
MTTAIDDLTMEQLANMSDEDLAKLESGQAIQQEGTTEQGVNEDSQSQADDANKSAAAAQQEESTAQAEDEPAGVATKAGDKIIPYTVLEQARKDKTTAEERATTLEQQKTEADAKVEELTKQLQSMTTADVGDIRLMSDDEIDAIAEDMPELAETVKGMRDQLKALNAQVVKHKADTQEEERTSAVNSVQEAIDNVPKLAFLQANNPRLWQLATNIDAELRGTPEAQNLSLEERFELVVQTLEKDVGFEIKLEAKKTETPKAKEAAPLLSISDLKGGSTLNEEQNEVDETSTQVSLIDKMSRMTPKQMDEFLSS